MANVVVKVLGSNDLKSADAETIGALKSQLNLIGFSANINGEAASDDTILSDDSLVTFAPSVKGGLK